jgi:hypothetical protein
VGTALFEDKDMALRNEDRDWIANEIRTAIQEHLHPHGWRKAVNVLKELAPLGGIFMVVLSLIAIIVTLGIALGNKREADGKFQGYTEQRLSTIEASLKNLTASVEGIRLKQSSSNATDPQNINQAKSVLARAQSSNIQLDKDVVSEAGSSFVKASEKVPAAWNVAVDFLAYRTTLNINLAAVTSASQIATTSNTTLTTEYKIFQAEGYESPTVSVGGDVSAQQAADIHPLDEPSLNAGKPRGREVILIVGGGLRIDGFLLKNVVIKNTAILYSGGPVQLQNVIFVNCTFVLTNIQPSRNFADAVLSQPLTSFIAG